MENVLSNDVQNIDNWMSSTMLFNSINNFNCTKEKKNAIQNYRKNVKNSKVIFKNVLASAFSWGYGEKFYILSPLVTLMHHNVNVSFEIDLFEFY